LGIPAHDVGLHAFRHGLATELANASVPLPALQRQMRHADVRTTLKIYSNLVSETRVDVMEKLAQRSIGTNVAISTEVDA
jgi:integrase